jgi:hypothetical protein
LCSRLPGIKKFINESKLKNYNGIILETAHPAKLNIVESAVEREIENAEALKSCLEKKSAVKYQTDFPI